MEHKISREAISMAFDRLIEDLCRNAVKICQVMIEHAPVAADDLDIDVKRTFVPRDA